MGSVVQFGRVGKRTPKDVPAPLAEQETNKGLERAFRTLIAAVILIPWGLLALAFWRACR